MTSADEEEFTMEHLEEIEAEWLAMERRREPDPDLWRWSPTPLPKFVDMLGVASMCREIMDLDRKPRFFEAGCGVGTKLVVAKQFGLEELGWELFPEYVEQARALGVNVEQHDLRQDEPDWGSFDIVFLSRPFKDDEENRQFEQRAMDAMRPGAVLMSSFAGVKPYGWRWLYKGPWRVVAVKPVPGEPRRKFRVEPFRAA